MTSTATAPHPVAAFDDLMLPAGWPNNPEAACGCGGLLAWRGGRWVHVDACPECWTRIAGWTGQPCPNPAGHTACTRPSPEPCEHHHRGIAVDSSLIPYPCAAERENCCGCCHGED